MKICPNCRRTYNEPDLRFCMQDGTPLETVQTEANNDLNDAPTVIRRSEQTEILPPNEPIYRQQIPVAPPPRTSPNAAAPTFQTSSVEPKSNTTKIVLLTALGTLGLVTAFGIAWFALFKRDKADVAETNVNLTIANTRNANIRSNSNANATNANSNLNLNLNNNANINANTNLANANTLAFPNTNSNIANSTPSPTPKPTIAPEQAKKIREELDGSLTRWQSASQDGDLDGLLKQYAPTVDYYKGGKMSVNQVRTDKERAYNEFDVAEMKVTNVKINPDASGEKATVTFDKEWNFENDTRFNRGKVVQQLTYERVKGEWKITGERDLKVYFNDKGNF